MSVSTRAAHRAGSGFSLTVLMMTLMAVVITTTGLSVGSASATSAVDRPAPAGSSATGPLTGQLPVPASAQQILTVAAPSAGFSYATLAGWQHNSNGSWTRKFVPVAARVGRNGIGQAHEGSEFTPAGTFPLDQAFGRLANPGIRLPYFTTDTRDWWDENSSSPTYNLHVRRISSPGGASENLYSAGTAYDLAVNIAYNPTRIPGKGSAFFLHVGTGSPTAGCVSIDQPTLRSIMRWLDPAQHPVIDIRNGAAFVPKTPTTLSQTTPSRRVPAGHPTSLTGTLVSVAGEALGGQMLVVAACVHGSTDWRHVGDVKTGTAGRYTYTFTPSGAKDYQIRWAGGSIWSGSHSRPILILTT